MALLTLKPTKWEYAEITSPSQIPLAKDVNWVSCKHFPTEIHWELLDAGVIPDWNIGRAEHDVEWVSKRTWAFRSEIDLSGVELDGKQVEIEFQSLDTFATVYLVCPLQSTSKQEIANG
jgi:beta-mannosidase